MIQISGIAMVFLSPPFHEFASSLPSTIPLTQFDMRRLQVLAR